MAESASPSSNSPREDELADLIQRFVDSLAEYSDRLPFALDRQKLRSFTTLAALAITLVFAWKLLRAPADQQRRPRRRPTPSISSSTSRTRSGTRPSSDVFLSSGDSRAQDAVDQFFQPVKLTLEQLVRHKLCEGRKVTCQLLGVILQETTPEELQKHATVRSSVLEVLLEITKFCDVYLMERILDDESEEKVLSALSDAGVFTTGGLVKDKVLFCSTENGRISFVRQLEPDWHIDTNPEIIHQLAVKVYQIPTPYFAKQSRACGFKCIQLCKPGAVLWGAWIVNSIKTISSSCPAVLSD
ncbi:Peroxisome biogenesis protein 22 [Ananas comosus]|uniref:Peroxisome biogenesis protein 22 n=1 Tax=Ananas comosus TaxID=4615 RepID=A0A199UFL8_ANACO|nr:Peroxisome biogenesis protein 22 [Ananas comosus]